MADPYAYFIVEHISRAKIAERLNRHLGRDKYTSDDDRLTDDVCRGYASDMGWATRIGERGDVNDTLLSQLLKADQ